MKYYNEFGEEFNSLIEAIEAEEKYLSESTLFYTDGNVEVIGYSDYHPEITHIEDGKHVIDWSAEGYVSEMLMLHQEVVIVDEDDYDEYSYKVVKGVTHRNCSYMWIYTEYKEGFYHREDALNYAFELAKKDFYCRGIEFRY